MVNLEGQTGTEGRFVVILYLTLEQFKDGMSYICGRKIILLWDLF